MSRGQYSLFNSLIEPHTIPVTSFKKGRSIDFINKRNTCLMHRYYYYAKLHRWTYDDAVSELSKEFFISEIRIVVCLNENRPALKNIFEKKPEVKELRNTFSWLVWSPL